MSSSSKNKNLYVTINGKQINVENGISYKNEMYHIISNTNLYDLKLKPISLEKILAFYDEGKEISNIVSNPFTIVIVNKLKQEIYCIQDINGDTIPIYYYLNNYNIIISNKLTNIINNYFSINETSIKTFLKKGYIPGSETLIKNINKLVPKKNLYINLETNEENYVKKITSYCNNKKNDINNYIKTFKEIITTNSKNKNIHTSLSNGYDSNFIFNLLDKNKHIEAFSIGGNVGRDETKSVIKNIKKYKNVNLNTAYVTNNTLDNYLEIIYLLDGSLYESGIFLQYELFKLLETKKDDNTIIFLGEGADQIFSYEYYKNRLSIFSWVKYFVKLFVRNLMLDEFKNYNKKDGITYKIHAYEYLSYLIIKKNGILMNNLSIETCYPFLNKNIINLGYTNRYKNYFKKQFHIKACKKIIDKNVIDNISKIGGTTNQKSLFHNCTYINEILLVVKNSKYNILKKKENINSTVYLDYVLKVLYLELFEYLYLTGKTKLDDKKNQKLVDVLKHMHK